MLILIIVMDPNVIVRTLVVIMIMTKVACLGLSRQQIPRRHKQEPELLLLVRLCPKDTNLHRASTGLHICLGDGPSLDPWLYGLGFGGGTLEDCRKLSSW